MQHPREIMELIIERVRRVIFVHSCATHFRCKGMFFWRTQSTPRYLGPENEVLRFYDVLRTSLSHATKWSTSFADQAI